MMLCNWIKLKKREINDEEDDYILEIGKEMDKDIFNSKQIEVPNFIFPLGRLSYDYPQYQNKNNSFNIKINLLNFNFKNNILLNCI